MPVSFPTDDEADRTRPTRDEARLNARAFATAVAPEGGLTRLQGFALRGLTQALTADLIELGDLDLLEPITPEEYAEANADRDRWYRIRRVQTMVLLELLLRPLPDDVVRRVEAFADALGVGEDCREAVAATRHLSAGATDLALADFMRNGYEVLQLERAGQEPPSDVGEFWASVHDDPVMAARWAGMEGCPPGSAAVSGSSTRPGASTSPGTPNSVSPRLAQHDFVHVLSDYGTTVESEIEVFALIARADEDPRSFSLLVAVLALFETGYLDRGLGAFRADPGHLTGDPSGMGVRLADAINRGGEVAWRFHEQSGIDLLAVDWFARAHEDLDRLREEFGFDGPGAKSLEAKAAGSAGPFQPGGITVDQVQWGRDMAAADDRAYEPYGSSLSGDQVASADAGD